MAGAGYKDFTAGDVLTAAQLDTFLMEQTIMVFASASARDTALSAVKADGMLAYLKDAPKRMTRYNGTVWNTVWSDWVAFTPNWTNITLGNGTNDFEYRYASGGMLVRGILTWGSTTSCAGTVLLRVPNSETSRSTGGYSGGSIDIRDSGFSYTGSAHLPVSSTLISFTTEGASYLLNATNPMVWTTGDKLRLLNVLVAL